MPATFNVEGSAHGGRLMAGRLPGAAGGKAAVPAGTAVDAIFMETGFVDVASLGEAQTALMLQLNGRVSKWGWEPRGCGLDSQDRVPPVTTLPGRTPAATVPVLAVSAARAPSSCTPPIPPSQISAKQAQGFAVADVTSGTEREGGMRNLFYHVLLRTPA